MGKGIFGTLHGFFESGDVYGRRVANAGFMRALLMADPFAEYHIFVSDPDTQQRHVATHADTAAVARGAVRVFGRQGLAAALRETRYFCFHLADPLSHQPALAVLRNAVAPRLFPVTGVTHSINYLEYAQGFLSQIWPGATPRDAIGATSAAAVGALREYFDQLRAGYGLPSDWGQPVLECVPLGVDATAFAPPEPAFRAEARARFCPEAEAVLCLAHGRIALDDKMDLMPLLFALRRVMEEHEGARLKLALSGRQREGDHYPEALAAAARAMKLDVVLIPGPSDAALRALYAAADIFVSPSDNLQETFGLTMLEAAACGLPIVASDWDGYRDLVADGVTGFLVPTLAPGRTPDLDILAHCLPDNIHQLFRAQQTVVDVPSLARVLARLAMDAPLRRRMGAAGRERARARDWRHVIDLWLAFWERLWQSPISPAEESRLRGARHPAFLDISRLFGGYAAELFFPDGDCRLRLSPRGERVRAGKEFCVSWQGLEHCMEGADTRRMLVLARRPIAAGELLMRMRGGGLAPEAAQFALLWALKNDLLERA